MKYKYLIVISVFFNSMLINTNLVQAAAEDTGGCIVERAAQAALDRQIKSIEAAQTDVSSFFKGPDSCINGNLLDMIDYSKFMLDPTGLISSLGQNQINNMLNKAVQKACDIANEQIQDVTGDLTQSLASWDSGLDDDIRGIISDGQIMPK